MIHFLLRDCCPKRYQSPGRACFGAAPKSVRASQHPVRSLCERRGVRNFFGTRTAFSCIAPHVKQGSLALPNQSSSCGMSEVSVPAGFGIPKSSRKRLTTFRAAMVSVSIVDTTNSKLLA